MFTTISLGSARSPVTVVGVTSDGKTVPAAHAKVAAVAEALDTPGFAGENGEVLAVGATHVLLGLGASDAVTPATVRVAAAKLVKALDRRSNLCWLFPVRGGLSAAPLAPRQAHGSA